LQKGEKKMNPSRLPAGIPSTWIATAGLLLALSPGRAALAGEPDGSPAARKTAVRKLIDRAEWASRMGHYDQAIAYAKRAISMNDPDLGYLAYKRLGVAQVLSGQLLKGKATLERCIELKPDFASGYYNLACTHARLGNRNAALDMLARAMALQKCAGNRYGHLALTDPDFDVLRGDPEFRSLCMSDIAAGEQARPQPGECEEEPSPPPRASEVSEDARDGGNADGGP
jgi:tetratricopeptide (TPR) repeat protein